MAKNGSTSEDVKRLISAVTGNPGREAFIPKEELTADFSYQRVPSPDKVDSIRKDFFYPAFGRVLVGHRADGTHVVIDGWHRVSAAKMIDRVTLIPCIVFDNTTPEQEALIWDISNTHRKPVSVHSRHRDRLLYGNRDAKIVQTLLETHGFTHGKSGSTTNIRCLDAVYSMVYDVQNANRALAMVSELVRDAKTGTNRRMVSGMFYLSRNIDVEGGVTNPRLRKRILRIGFEDLDKGAKIASVEYGGSGGGRIWAVGMLEVINSGLKNRFRLKHEQPTADI